MKPLDPRTHLLALLLASVLSLLVADGLQTHLSALLAAAYLAACRLPRQALLQFAVYTGLRTLLHLSVIGGWGASVAVFYAFSKMMPMFMIAVALTSAPPGVLLCAFEKWRAPKPVLIMLCILLRFFPVVLREMGAIREGIRARGVFSRGYSALRHPLMAYECFFTPLIVRCLKLSSELASAAELRGIACANRRTSIHPVAFKAGDVLALALFVVLGAGIYGLGS